MSCNTSWAKLHTPAFVLIPPFEGLSCNSAYLPASQLNISATNCLSSAGEAGRKRLIAKRRAGTAEATTWLSACCHPGAQLHVMTNGINIIIIIIIIMTYDADLGGCEKVVSINGGQGSYGGIMPFPECHNSTSPVIYNSGMA